MLCARVTSEKNIDKIQTVTELTLWSSRKKDKNETVIKNHESQSYVI